MTDGLVLRAGPGIPDGLTIPESDLEERFSKSSGPGGQSVNTTDSRVEVSLDLSAVTGARATAQRERAIGRLGRTLTVTASEHRSQHRNRVAARRMADRLREALAPPPLTRVPTKPTKGSQRRRVESKKRRSQLKSLRGRVRDD